MEEQSHDLKRIHERLLYMVISIRDVLEKNNVQYMLAYGSLLGAVRHKGFIPWDDDVDLLLFSDSYDFAVEKLHKELPDDMMVEDKSTEKLFYHAWARVRDKRTECVSKKFLRPTVYFNKGLGVDLFKAQRLKLSELQSWLIFENYNYIMRMKNLGLIEEDEYLKRMKQLEKDRQKETIIENDREVFGLINTSSCKKLEMNDVFPLVQYKFEDELLYGPNNADKILTDFYGNYMELPPLSQRTQHCSSVIFK